MRQKCKNLDNMKKIKYFETIALFYSGIFDQIKQGIDLNSAISIEFDSDWQYPEKENRLSNLIVLIHCLDTVYALHKSFTSKEIELYQEHLAFIKDEDLTQWLDKDELEHFNETVFLLNYEIETFLQKK
jgi:hypothetical protein